MNTTRTAPGQSVRSLSTDRPDAVELTALAMTIIIATGAFVWSFDGLTELATMAGIKARLAWIGPIFVDGAIVQSSVVLYSIKKRGRAGIVVPPATKRFFYGQLFAAELISVVGNGLHAAESDHLELHKVIAAAVAGAAPLAGLAATHGLIALIEIPRSAPKPVDAVAVRVDTAVDPVDAEWTAVDSGRAALDSGSTTAVQALDSGVEPDPLAARDTEIRRRYAEGESTRKIGAAVGLSHSRVAQIVATSESVDTGTEVLSLVR